jgi:hypothetical protein
MIIYDPFKAIYVPALAFSQTTGIDVHLITPIVMAICKYENHISVFIAK